MLGTPPERAVVVEDAISGVRAGRAGSFGLVVGVARGETPEVLRESGADLVVHDLAELDLV
jgi:beta-phosphoglucomutase-like phosphatase (HAD superfamily)